MVINMNQHNNATSFFPVLTKLWTKISRILLPSLFQQVELYRSGKETVFKAILGQVIKKSEGITVYPL